jgi:hypothetical protein
MDSVHLVVNISGVPLNVDITGKGRMLSSILFDGKEIPSAVIPEDINNLKQINLILGKIDTPYLNSANAIVTSLRYNKETKTLEFDLESFEGHEIKLQIISPLVSQKIFLNGDDISGNVSKLKKDNFYEINLQHISVQKKNHYSIKFN